MDVRRSKSNKPHNRTHKKHRSLPWNRSADECIPSRKKRRMKSYSERGSRASQTNVYRTDRTDDDKGLHFSVPLNSSPPTGSPSTGSLFSISNDMVSTLAALLELHNCLEQRTKDKDGIIMSHNVRIADLEGKLRERNQAKPSHKCVINLLEDDEDGEDGEAKQVQDQTTWNTHTGQIPLKRPHYPNDPRNGYSYQTASYERPIGDDGVNNPTSPEYNPTEIAPFKNATDATTGSIQMLTTSSLAFQNTMDYLEHLGSNHCASSDMSKEIDRMLKMSSELDTGV